MPASTNVAVDVVGQTNQGRDIYSARAGEGPDGPTGEYSTLSRRLRWPSATSATSFSWLDQTSDWLRREQDTGTAHGHPPQPDIERNRRLYADASLLFREAYGLDA